ncbi:MAG: ParA family protein [Oscillospiraceae bacterium]|nr:ParA family protein [Oscillospiraceae bacterium]
MGKIIAVANQKGGVGKTTTCVSMCAALNEIGVKALLCDMDPQSNATSGMGFNKDKTVHNMYSVLIEGEDVKKAIHSTPYGDLLPSNSIMSGAGVEIVGMTENARNFVLKNTLSVIKNDYDFIFIDCPPSLEMLTLNSLCAADTVLIPVQCEYFALEGLKDLMTTIRMTKKAYNPELEIEGVLLTMYDSRTNLSSQIATEIKKYFKDKTYNIAIPRSVRIAEAPSHGKPIIDYDRYSRGSLTYQELAKEFIKRNNHSKGGGVK